MLAHLCIHQRCVGLNTGVIDRWNNVDISCLIIHHFEVDSGADWRNSVLHWDWAFTLQAENMMSFWSQERPLNLPLLWVSHVRADAIVCVMEDLLITARCLNRTQSGIVLVTTPCGVTMVDIVTDSRIFMWKSKVLRALTDQRFGTTSTILMQDNLFRDKLLLINFFDWLLLLILHDLLLFERWQFVLRLHQWLNVGILLLFNLHHLVDVDARFERYHLLHQHIFPMTLTKVVHIVHQWFLVHNSLGKLEVILVDSGSFTFLMREIKRARPSWCVLPWHTLEWSWSPGTTHLFLFLNIDRTVRTFEMYLQNESLAGGWRVSRSSCLFHLNALLSERLCDCVYSWPSYACVEI